MKSEKFKNEYELYKEEFELAKEIIKMRKKADLTQKQCIRQINPVFTKSQR